MPRQITVKRIALTAMKIKPSGPFKNEDCGGCCKLIGGIARLCSAQCFPSVQHRGSDLLTLDESVARLLERS